MAKACWMQLRLLGPLTAVIVAVFLPACYGAQNGVGPNTYVNSGTYTVQPNQLTAVDAALTPPGPLTLVYGITAQQCLAVVGSGSTINVQFLPCDGSAAQQWSYQHGQLQASNGSCLSVPQSNPAPGTPSQLVPCDATYTVTNQLWQYQSGQLVLTDTGLCMLPAQSSPVASVWKCGGTAANNDTMWVLGHSSGAGVFGSLWTPVGAKAPCMSADPNTGAVTLGACANTAYQSWAAAGASIISLGAGACLTLDPTQGASGAAATLEGCNGSVAQQWTWQSGQVRVLGTNTCVAVDALNAGSPLHGISCMTTESTAQWALGL